MGITSECVLFLSQHLQMPSQCGHMEKNEILDEIEANSFIGGISYDDLTAQLVKVSSIVGVTYLVLAISQTLLGVGSTKGGYAPVRNNTAWLQRPMQAKLRTSLILFFVYILATCIKEAIILVRDDSKNTARKINLIRAFVFAVPILVVLLTGSNILGVAPFPALPEKTMASLAQRGYKFSTPSRRGGFARAVPRRAVPPIEPIGDFAEITDETTDAMRRAAGFNF